MITQQWCNKMKHWFRRILLGELIAKIIDNRRAFYATNQIVVNMRADVMTKIGVMERNLDSLCKSSLDGIDLLVKAVETLPAHIPFSWREYECVNYAVSKMENDPEASAIMPQEQQFNEILRWSRLYCYEHDWLPPATERLKTLIESRLRHGKEKTTNAKTA